MDKDQIMKFHITNDKLKMEITLKDLVWLFHNSPDNMSPYGNEEFCKIKKGKEKEFAEWVVEQLQEDSPWDDNNVCWGQLFEDAFNKIFEGYETCDNFCDCIEDELEDE